LNGKLGNLCVDNSRDTKSRQAVLHDRLTYLVVRALASLFTVTDVGHDGNVLAH